jgi:hypothetical protein
MPIMLLGGAIIAVVAALIFWPTAEEPTTSAARAKDRAGAAAAGAVHQGAAAAPGGVQPRPADEPTRRAVEPKLNPAVRLPEGIGNAPAMPEPEVVPDFDTLEEEVAYYEKKLALAIEARDRREKNVARMETVRQRAEQSANPEQELEVFESRKKIVEDNFAKAQEKVDELEAKLDDLRR